MQNKAECNIIIITKQPIINTFIVADWQVYQFKSRILNYSVLKTGWDASKLNFKLAAQKVKEFKKAYNEWQQGKRWIECTFNGSGYE